MYIFRFLCDYFYFAPLGLYLIISVFYDYVTTLGFGDYFFDKGCTNPNSTNNKQQTTNNKQQTINAKRQTPNKINTTFAL
jgi:hypothetical protein